MNRETLRAGLFTLLAESIPRNARRISCAYYDDQPQRNALGLRVDPQPIEGRVVAITDEAFIVKTARTSFAAVDRELATRCPAVGDKVRVTPYCRRDFTSERLDAPRQENCQGSDGQAYVMTVVTLGGNTARIPLPSAPNCPYLADMVEQLEMLPTPDGLRTIANLLVDAGAHAVEVVDPEDEKLFVTPPEISFAVATQKFAGRVAVRYDRGDDLYVVELRADGTVVTRIEEVDFMSLAGVLADLIDDGQWRRIHVEILQANH
ncbi:GTPase [Dechloromonas agitata]|uniref:GTPase n=1 Tax=Dechloromonas agitata TaxID=73030 RepID=UPI00237EBBAA|nr:GTPase [Dechloromonas agitata]MDE1544100.1 GTPase [Dechloromonas agitata]